jgi:hypothetical protein
MGIDQITAGQYAPGANNQKGSPLKDFPNASFSPDLIGIMQKALESSVATRPHPVSSAHVRCIAETILRSAKEGEQDAATLQRLALLELEIVPR